jgi:hypothetical protein
VLTHDPPAGDSIGAITYPRAIDLDQAGQREPLAVYGPEFTVVVRLALAADAAVDGLVIPARLRYQACDATTCYPPAKAETRWTLSSR